MSGRPWRTVQRSPCSPFSMPALLSELHGSSLTAEGELTGSDDGRELNIRPGWSEGKDKEWPLILFPGVPVTEMYDVEK